MGWPFALETRRNVALDPVVAAKGKCLDSSSTNQPFLTVPVAKTDMFGKHEKRGDTCPGQVIFDTAAGGGARENVCKKAAMAETRERWNPRCRRRRSVGSLILNCAAGVTILEAGKGKALAGVKSSELQPMRAAAVSCLRDNQGKIKLANRTAFSCLEKSQGDMEFIISGMLPCSLAI